MKVFMLSIKNYLVSLLLLQQIDYNEFMKGSWWYCENSEYYEIHFRDEYLDVCPEYFNTGTFYPYEFKGDSLLFKMRNGDIQPYQFRIISSDTVVWVTEDESIDDIMLVKLDTTIIIPDSKLEQNLVKQYKSDYQERLKKHSCRPSM